MARSRRDRYRPGHVTAATPRPPRSRPRRALAACLAAVAAALPLLLARCGDDTPGKRAPEAPHTSQPNVLVIVMDTVRADHTTLCGYARPTTPRVAQFAADGVTYRDAWTPAGWTGPSHASLFTGQRPVHHGYLEDNIPLLRSQAVTLAEILRDAGWRTGCFSNNAVVSDAYGLVQGFEHAPRFFLNQQRPLPNARDAHRRAKAFIETSVEERKPFFVYVNDFEPHLPYEPLEEHQRTFVPADVSPELLHLARHFNNPYTIDLNVGLADPVPAPEMLALLPSLYDAEIATVDAEVGAFLDELRADGLLDRTLVVITSDHGENLGDHGLWDHRFSIHRTIRHVPLVLRYPGRLDGGRVVDDVVRLEDVLPTVLEVCGLPPRADVDGVSLLAPTAGRISRASYAAQSDTVQTFRSRHPDLTQEQERPFHVSQRSVYDGRHDLIVRSDGTLELYDVTADPGETKNLADELPDVVARLRALLDP